MTPLLYILISRLVGIIKIKYELLFLIHWLLIFPLLWLGLRVNFGFSHITFIFIAKHVCSCRRSFVWRTYNSLVLIIWATKCRQIFTTLFIKFYINILLFVFFVCRLISKYWICRLGWFIRCWIVDIIEHISSRLLSCSLLIISIRIVV